MERGQQIGEGNVGDNQQIDVTATQTRTLGQRTVDGGQGDSPGEGLQGSANQERDAAGLEDDGAKFGKDRAGRVGPIGDPVAVRLAQEDIRIDELRELGL